MTSFKFAKEAFISSFDVFSLLKRIARAHSLIVRRVIVRANPGRAKAAAGTNPKMIVDAKKDIAIYVFPSSVRSNGGSV